MRSARRGLEEVAGCNLPHRNVVHLVRRRIEYFEVALQVLVQLQNRCNVATPVAVVRRRPDRDQAPGEHPLVPLHDELVCPGNELDAIDVVELLADVAAEEVAGTSRAEAPSRHVLGVGPKQVAHRSLVRDFLLPVDAPDLVQRRDVGRKAAVDSQHDAIHEGREAEVIENLHAVAPHVQGTVLADALVVETVNLGDLPTLVVAADEADAVRVANFQSEEKQKGLHAVESPVHEVAHEEVVRPGAVRPDLEKLKQVEELPMDVPANGNRRVDLLHVALLGENLDRTQAKPPHLHFAQELALPELVDACVQVKHFHPKTSPTRTKTYGKRASIVPRVAPTSTPTPASDDPPQQLGGTSNPSSAA
eukprot:CAMPEP_0198234436 /NCGR_PEP_ID=MMETSP1446-20131203/457_1 /TAXON_ID=1461542 ORGANISM="Unidentified sp, Strain CCMP2111" /NCGR_SAMPLE_ID=MMETSP1446 /ASSEMBLY_ACC=CAM_ASM_001112 /LENGTH=362 /DNA_ID=CAMNT_0043915217 /DNA_START=63 /DNA_END=1152 /DNA_ORIENTATION=-